MRLFIGIPFSENLRSQIRKNVVALRSFIAKGRLSPWEGYHITLKFLGEVSSERMAELALLMAKTPLRTAPFELRFTELGAFRKSGGDVLWLGVTLPPQLLALQKEIEALAGAAGFEPESRSYTPHLTLGRGVRYTEGFEEAAGHWTPLSRHQWVDHIALFQSVQIEGRLTYVPLVSITLGDAETGMEEAEEDES